MSGVNQKEYLKKYLSLGREPGQKKKRKKKPSAVLNRVKIIDDDVDVTFNEAVEEDLHGLTEDAPQIVGVIDDRPLELRISDYRDNDMWKAVGAEDSIRDNIANNSSDNEIHINTENSSKNVQKITQLTSNKYSDDYSPPRKRKDSDNISKTQSNDKDFSKGRERGRRYDKSPTHASKRHSRRSNRTSSDSSDEGHKRHRNASPPRKGRNERGDISPPRKKREHETSPRRNKSNDRVQKRWDSGRSPVRKNKAGDDMSPPRKYSRDERDTSQNRRGSKVSSERRNSDRSPVRRNKVHDDMSPPRRYARDRDISPKRRRRNQTDDDVSPPGRNKREKNITPPRRNSSRSPVRRSPPTRIKRDRDVSPERRNSDRSSERRNKIDEDVSPARRHFKDYGDSRTVKNDGSTSSRTRRNSDVSTSRVQRHDSNRSPSYSRRYNYEESRKSSSFNSGDYDKYKSSRGERKSRTESDRSPSARHSFGRELSPSGSRNEKQEENPATKSRAASSGAPRKSRWDDETPSIERFLIARKSGLQRANELIEQHDLFKDMAGPSAAIVAPIVRDRKTGKIRDFKKEEEEATMKQEKDDELKAKYDKWGKGLKQVEAATEKINEELHEMSKPLARYADDEDLEKHLKEMERDGDPMLDYLRKKKRRKDIDAGETFKPQFEGEFMPNRFGIRPGHRWDGVDRSNGYEKKWFEVMNSRRAQQEEAYKWSTEDM